MAKTIAANGGDFVVEPEMEQKATATGLWEAAASLSNGTGFFSATLGGTAIDASLSVVLAGRSGDANRYFGVLQGSAIETQLAALVGSTIWLCRRFGTSATDVDFEEWTLYEVTDYRRS